jgi:hypothetical protein
MPIFEFNKPETFQPAIDKAWEDLMKLDPNSIIENANVTFDESKHTFTVPVLNQEYQISLKDKKIHFPGGEINEHVYGAITVLLLHYLINARSTTLKNKLITYRELPDGMVFYNAFRSIAIQPIADKYGYDLDGFAKAAEAIGGRKVNHGEIAYEFYIFPRVPVTYLLWAGDDEIPGSANILFDASASEQLHTEDLAEVGEVITHHLID